MALHNFRRTQTQRVGCVAEGIGEGFGQRYAVSSQKMDI